MDSARAKSIVLILLVAFNMYLLSRVVVANGYQQVSKETIANTGKILESRNVELDCKLTRYNSDTPKLEFGNSGLSNTDMGIIAGKFLGEPYVKLETSDSNPVYERDKKKITFNDKFGYTYEDKNPTGTVDIIHIKETEKYLKEFFKKKGLGYNSFTLDEQPVKQGSVIVFNYIEKYKSFLVFENYMKVKVSDKGVSYLEVWQREIINLTRNVSILAAYQILLDNFTGDDKVIITSVDIGYKLPADYEQNQLQSSEQLPVWRVKIKGDNQPKYYSVSDGKEIK
jgi:YycH protein.